MWDRDKIVKLIERGLSSRQISLEVGKSRTAVAYFLEKNHLKTQHRPSKRKNSSDEYTSQNSLRLFLLRRRGNICQECKRKNWNNKEIPLQVHHIDGNSDNNAEENLLLLCPNCHALTPNFNGKNRGKVTGTKRQIYKNN